MRIFLIFISIVVVFLCSSCSEKGCIDDKALNFEPTATEADNSCMFSTCIFYRSLTEINGYEIDRIELRGNYFGEEQEPLSGDLDWIYEGTSPPNCSASGTIQYKFTSGENFEWNTMIYLKDTSLVYGTGGIITANPNNECIKVNVTQ